MIKYFTSTFSVINLYKKPSTQSEVVTQILYGESFSVSQKKKNGLKLKLKKIIIKVIFKTKIIQNTLNQRIKLIN